MSREIWLIRHGETAWSLSGQHTGRKDIPLTPKGESDAMAVGRLLSGRQFSLVLTSPLQRAKRTCELAGFGKYAETDERLCEWDYGEYEGLTSAQIQAQRPGWTVFRDGVEGGETLAAVAERARAVIARAMAAEGDVALFAHGHILRVLAACWLGLPPMVAESFALGAAGVSVLGFEHETRVLLRWNLRADGASY